ncbi:hypothetical protein HK102_007257 [Quaeritorhiza haematococci]|nr:hypothetical protein HK102_007257 [Quaeritorhiza haematococci]
MAPQIAVGNENCTADLRSPNRRRNAKLTYKQNRNNKSHRLHPYLHSDWSPSSNRRSSLQNQERLPLRNTTTANDVPKAPPSQILGLSSHDIGKRTASVQDHFKDIVERIWWSEVKPFAKDDKASRRPYPCDLNDSSDFTEKRHETDQDPPSRRNCLSLGQLAAFAVVTTLPEEEDGLEQVDVEENWYSEIPPHWRSMVLFQHVIQLYMEQVRIPSIFEYMIGVCLMYEAYHQAFDLLRHLWRLRTPTTFVEYEWAYSVAQRMNRVGPWIQFLCDTLSLDVCQDSAFHEFVEYLFCSAQTAPRHISDAEDHFMLLVSSAMCMLLRSFKRSRPVQISPSTHERFDIWIRRVVTFTASAAPHKRKYQVRALHSLSRRVDSAPLKLSIETWGAALLFRIIQVKPQQKKSEINRSMATPAAPRLIDSWLAKLYCYFRTRKSSTILQCFETLRELRRIADALKELEAYELAIQVVTHMVNSFEALKTEEHTDEHFVVLNRELQELERWAACNAKATCRETLPFSDNFQGTSSPSSSDISEGSEAQWRRRPATVSPHQTATLVDTNCVDESNAYPRKRPAFTRQISREPPTSRLSFHSRCTSPASPRESRRSRSRTTSLDDFDDSPVVLSYTKPLPFTVDDDDLLAAESLSFTTTEDDDALATEPLPFTEEDDDLLA